SLALTLYGDYATASAGVDEVTALADKSGSLIWKAVGMTGRGAILALTGSASDAVRLITSGLTTFRSTGGTLFAPLYLSHLARAHVQLGHLDDAWRCIDEAIATIETSKERWCEAEVHRVAGEIALMRSQPDVVTCEAHFERALAIARAQEAKSWELRTS